MELLVHINKRIKNNLSIQLPVESLLLQYQDPMATSFVINFTVIYLKMGFPRLPIEKQAELVPSVLASIEAKPTSHQDSLLLMIMPVLGEVAKQVSIVQHSTVVQNRFYRRQRSQRGRNLP